MSKNVIIANPKELEKKIRLFKKGGLKNFHVISDFDRTLTRALSDGKPVSSLIAIFYDGGYLPPEETEEIKQLHQKYFPQEIDVSIPTEEKRKIMKDWWEAVFAVLIKSGLTQSILDKVVDSGETKFRAGVSQFFYFLRQHGIPLLILSSSGIGGDTIRRTISRQDKFSENIHIISNTFIWDKDGRASGVNQPIITVANKDETVISDFPVFQEIKNRKNVLLLGDALEDAGMIRSFAYENLIKVGFLNQEQEKNLPAFKKVFDAVIVNDGSLDFVNEFLKQIE
jgi:HAD superfamily hydrolase (TIGR01544 family)